MAGAFRRNPWQFVGLVLALLYGLGTAVFVVVGLVTLRFVDVEIARSAVVVFGAVVIVLYTVLPLMIGVDDTLDPRRFALFGMSTTRLTVGLGVGALISVPALVILLISIALVATWSRTGASIGFAIASVPIIIVTCLLSSRVSTSIGALLLSTRRSRDIATVVIILAVISLAPGIAALAAVDWVTQAVPVLTSIERVVSWTPLGAPWAVAADAAAGDLTGAVWKLVISVGWIAALAFGWRLLVGLALVTPQRQAAARRYSGLGWFDRLPATPIGAIAARNLTYWGRDGRYGTSLAVIPVIPIIMIVALHLGGLPLSVLALLPVPIVCLFLSWAVHNDVSFDNTAVWLHLAASVTGRDDRWGRLLPVLLTGTPIVLVGSTLCAWAFGDWTVLPALIGVSACILLCGLGLSSIMSAAFPYPTVRPGDSPFAQPQGGGSPAGLAQALSFFAIIGLTAPALVFAGLGLLGSPMWFFWSLVVGLAVGLVALLVGTSLGARVYDRRAPAILAAAVRN